MGEKLFYNQIEKEDVMEKLFKNWPEICKIGLIDPLIMAAIACLDLDADNLITQRIISVFPECFCDYEIQGPIPMSILGPVLDEVNNDGCYKNDPDDVCKKFNIPYIWLRFNDTEPWEGDFGVIPKKLEEDENFQKACKNFSNTRSGGVVFEWKRKRLVVISYADVYGAGFVPLECVALDL